jgi:DNA-binding LacI/PurR family transcriptional regulator
VAYAQKFGQVMSVIEQRIKRGDYLLRPIPSERKIAEETGVSHMTARKAVRALLERKVLIRQINGALAISPTYHADARPAQVLLLYPAFPSAYLSALCQEVSNASEAYGMQTRAVPYVHWDDPVVFPTVSKPGGVIIIPSSLDVPPYILTAMRSNRVVSLDGDLSDKHVPSIRLFSDSHIFKVFDHLQRLGHSRIDCISSHVRNREIDRRIQLWRDWSYRHGCMGEFWENAAPSFSDPTPFAYEGMKQLLAKGPLKATAFVGTTFPAAVGAMRACWDHGLIVGKDVSICSINIESPARFIVPSVTGLDMPDLSKLLRDCFEWFNSDHPWEGPKNLGPARAELFAGESTGVPNPISN